jgi:pimeloyl-ACP methyl ester carboxylesterase
VEQAMQDFNLLNLEIRQKWNMTVPTSPFVVFGGSYGGNLALWLRLKHPNLWSGAIASSITPLKHLLRETNGFTRIETEAYANVSHQCPDLIRQGWKELYEQAETVSGRENIANALHLCSADRVRAGTIHGWISSALETMVQYGYPYPTNFYNPVPGFPFKVACEKMVENQTGLGSLYAAASVYYNYTGQAGCCFEFDSILQDASRYMMHRGRYDLWMKQSHDFLEGISVVECHERHLIKWQETDRAWGYQTCTEVYQVRSLLFTQPHFYSSHDNISLSIPSAHANQWNN